MCVCVYVCAKALQSCLTLCNTIQTVAGQAPLSTGFYRQEYWSAGVGGIELGGYFLIFSVHLEQ